MSYKLLIDADIVLYQACLQAEDEICWDPEGERNIWSLDTDLAVAKEVFTKKIEQFKTYTNVEDALLCFSSKHNFRKNIVSSEYKSNRKDTRKPLGYGEMKAWAKTVFETDERDGLEADDLIAWYTTEYPGEWIIVSMDKDFFGIPGKFFRVSPKGKHEFHEISEKDAKEFFYTQVLTGDPVDGYFGVPGFGGKTAEKWLVKNGYTWDSVVKAYESKGLSAEIALQEARMAKLLDNSLYVDGSIKLWEPTNGK